MLDGLHVKSDFRFLPDKTHGVLCTRGKDHDALLMQISSEIHAVARPGSRVKASSAMKP